MASCPTCRREAAPRRDNAFFPFCSERCKLVDLGRWLRGEYRVPVTDDKPEASAAEPGSNGKDNGNGRDC